MPSIFDELESFSNRAINEIAEGHNLSDFAHAHRLFVGSNFRLNPKNTFLFHLFIDINPNLASSLVANNISLTELGLMVKSADLPKYTVDTKTYNSYNRPNIVQNKIKFDPIGITFHDDNANVVRNFWYDYYRYYFRDSDHGAATYNSEYKYRPQLTGKFGFSRRSDTYMPFINSVRLYSLHQKRFSEYILLNPVIRSFKHGVHSQGSEGVMEHNMVIEYENVLYSDGFITEGSPTGFAELHYDTNPSPLILGGNIHRVFGPGGLLNTADNVYKDLEDQQYLSAIFKTARAVNTARSMNLKNSLVSELSTYYAGEATDAIRGVINQQIRYNNGNGYHVPSLNASESLISDQYTGLPVNSSLPSLAGTAVALTGIKRKAYPLYRPVRQGAVDTQPTNYNLQFPNNSGVTRPDPVTKNLYIANDQQGLRQVISSSQTPTAADKQRLDNNVTSYQRQLDNLYNSLTERQKESNNLNTLLADLNTRLGTANSAPPSANKTTVVAQLQNQITNTQKLYIQSQQRVNDTYSEISNATDRLNDAIDLRDTAS